MMLRFGLLLTAGALILGVGRDARACSCVRMPNAAQHYYQGADVVFIGRADVRAKGRFQTFRVLVPLKGKVVAGGSFDIDVGVPCASTYRRGEVALVFAKRHAATVCAGNYALSVQLRDLPGVLRAAAKARGKKITVPSALLRAGLAVALKGYLHGRRSIPLASKRLPKTLKLKLGKSMLYATPTMPKHAVLLHHALQFGPLAFIDGSYPREGLVFSVLLRQLPKAGKSPYELLYKRVAERKPSTNPFHRNRIP